MKLQKNAGLEYLDFPVDNPELNLVLLHGYGADAFDLAPLHDELRTKKRTRFIFLNAPQSVIIDSYTTGRAWFEIDILQLSLLMQQGNFDEFTKSIPKGLPIAREKVLGFLSKMDLDISKTVFGGFSQGSMLAIDVAFQLEQQAKGLLLFSSSLINSQELKTLAPKKKGMPFFMSHGKNDPLLRIEIAYKLEGLLQNSGLKGKLQVFNGAHEIPYDIIQSAKKFLETL